MGGSEITRQQTHTDTNTSLSATKLYVRKEKEKGEIVRTERHSWTSWGSEEAWPVVRDEDVEIFQWKCEKFDSQVAINASTEIKPSYPQSWAARESQVMTQVKNYIIVIIIWSLTSFTANVLLVFIQLIWPESPAWLIFQIVAETFKKSQAFPHRRPSELRFILSAPMLRCTPWY